jgi:hypothetical protein
MNCEGFNRANLIHSTEYSNLPEEALVINVLAAVLVSLAVIIPLLLLTERFRYRPVQVIAVSHGGLWTFIASFPPLTHKQLTDQHFCLENINLRNLDTHTRHEQFYFENEKQMEENRNHQKPTELFCIIYRQGFISFLKQCVSSWNIGTLVVG